MTQRDSRKGEHASAASRTWRTGMLLGLAGWAVGFGLGQIGISKYVDAPLYDAFVRGGDAAPDTGLVARVYVGDRDIETYQDVLGRWPWRSRIAHAEALRILMESGVTAVGFDIFFTEPSLEPESDEELMIAVAEMEHVVHGLLYQTQEGERWSGRGLSETAAAALAAAGGSYGVVPTETDVPEGRTPALPIDPLLEGSPLLGHCNPDADHDNAVRRVPLLLRDGDRLVPALSLRVAMLALGAGPEDVVLDPARRELRIVGSSGAAVHVPVDPDGALWVHWDRPAQRTEGFQYGDLALPEVQERLAGRVAVIGVSISGSSDLWKTPLGDAFPGFLIHSQVVENLLSGRMVRAIQPDRFPLGRFEAPANLLLLATCGLLGVVASRLPPRWAWTVTFAAVAVPVAVGAALLALADTWLTPATGALGLGFAGFLGVGYHQVLEARERRRVRRVYERYLSPRVLDAVLANPHLLHLGGARKELTVFFSDIRGFTEFAETVEPEELTERLNDYYGEMIALAHEAEATVDKLIGDNLMVFFGDPVEQPDHALRAVRMALRMQARIAARAAASRERGEHVFRAGMGIATGFVAVGNLGAESFVDYTVVGRVVNLAARLERDADPGEILISDRTYRAVEAEVEAECLGERTLRGIREPAVVYRVTGLRSRPEG